MKKTLLSIAVLANALIAVSCQKEDTKKNVSPEQIYPRFTATIESSDNTRTTVERYEYSSGVYKYKTKWESGDMVKINGSNYDVTPDASDPGKAVFTLSMNQGMSIGGGLPTPPYAACFPASLYDGAKYVLPASYTYVEGKYNMPMYAESDTEHLSFKNLCGVLAIKINNISLATLNSIEVESEDKRMNGQFTATADGTLTFTDATVDDASRKVTLVFNPAKTFSSDDIFYIPISPATHGTLKVSISGNTSSSPLEWDVQTTCNILIERNKVYPIVVDEPC